MTDFFAPASRGVQHANLRAANRRAVLNVVTFNPGLSNADVSRRTGLAPQTASAIVSELEAEGFIHRGDVLRGRRGQPATPLFPNYEAVYGIGCEIGWEHMQVTLIDLASREIARTRRVYAYPDARTIVQDAAREIATVADRLTPAQQKRLVGVGVSVPDHVDRWIGQLGAPPDQTETWKSLDVRKSIEILTGLETWQIANGNAGCFGEMTHRAPPRPPNCAYVFVDTQLEAGLVANHALWEGPNGNAANFGSMLVCAADGRRDTGHAAASTLTLRRMLVEAGLANPGPDTTSWEWDTYGQVLDAWVESAAVAIAQIWFNIAAVTDIEELVVDGVMPKDIAEKMAERARLHLTTLPQQTAGTPRIVAGRLGLRAIPIGTAQVPIYRKHFSRDYKDMGL